MFSLKKILCPTDFSEPSYRALTAANDLALHFSAKIILVHVVKPSEYMPIVSLPADPQVSSSLMEMTDLADKKLEQIVREKISEETKARSLVLQGNPADEIVRIAEDEDVDAIVIATHGLTGWRHLVFGSVAEKVVRLAPCMVITIRAPRTKHKRVSHKKMEAR